MAQLIKIKFDDKELTSEERDLLRMMMIHIDVAPELFRSINECFGVTKGEFDKLTNSIHGKCLLNSMDESHQ